MFIYGLGSDIVNVNRLKSILKKNKFFKKRIFSKNEILLCEKKKNSHLCFAKRFAAKESFSKSLGTGISKGLSFNEIEIKNDLLGKPYLKIHGKSLKTVHKIIKKKRFKVFLSLSDDKPFVIATVILTI
jgi:holo-[acyl-carrier protein] synthase